MLVPYCWLFNTHNTQERRATTMLPSWNLILCTLVFHILPSIAQYDDYEEEPREYMQSFIPSTMAILK